jgi:hypothetical protein
VLPGEKVEEEEESGATNSSQKIENKLDALFSSFEKLCES